MQIDLNDPNALTLENVRQLIASKDDAQHRQLRVTYDGIVFLSDDIGNRNLDGILFRFETWCAGNSYCGLDGSADDNWVLKIYNNLNENWPKPKSSYIDF
jgi:hypothetical protein